MSTTETELTLEQLAESWRPPEAIRPGDRVLVSRDTSWQDTRLGIVQAVIGRWADIVLPGTNRIHEECIHKQDPWVEMRPHLLNDDENRLIFELAPAEVELRHATSGLDDIHQMVAQFAGDQREKPAAASDLQRLADEVEHLKEAVEKLKVKRGRPPKEVPSE